VIHLGSACWYRVSDRWRVDEIDVKVSGWWRYVHRVVDQFGQVIDVYVSTRRDRGAA
jgi:transposase-like protein